MALLLRISVFLCGAAVMIVELVGTRLIAPFVGTSIFVWAACISAVLLSMAAGSYLGGRLADRNASYRSYAFILFLSSVGVSSTLILQSLAARSGLLTASIHPVTLAVAAALFIPPAFTLGMVTPFAIRLRLSDLSTSGAAVGGMYALSTAGSILGTLLGGIILISYFPSTGIILGTALSLFVLAAVFSFADKSRSNPTVPIAAAGALLLASLIPRPFPANGTLIADIDTPYSRAWVVDANDPASGRTIRSFTTTILGYQSVIDREDPSRIVAPYVEMYMLGDLFNKDITRALLIGGAMQVFPMWFAASHPNSTIESVDIDDSLLPIAREYFGFRDDPAIRTIAMDGRVFLNTAPGPYDAIYLDAFGSFLHVPFQLISKEAVAHMSRLLNPHKRGFVAMNMVSAVEGPGSGLLEAVYATFKSEFPVVLVFKVDPAAPSERAQNIVLFALKDASALPEAVGTATGAEERLLAKLIPFGKSGVPLLTDDFAPVERHIAAAIPILYLK